MSYISCAMFCSKFVIVFCPVQIISSSLSSSCNTDPRARTRLICSSVPSARLMTSPAVISAFGCFEQRCPIDIGDARAIYHLHDVCAWDNHTDNICGDGCFLLSFKCGFSDDGDCLFELCGYSEFQTATYPQLH